MPNVKYLNTVKLPLGKIVVYASGYLYFYIFPFQYPHPDRINVQLPLWTCRIRP